jgi:hypothetical protein
MNRQLRRKFAGLGVCLIAVLGAVIGLTASGWFGTGLSQSPVPPTTHVRLMQPFDLSGKLAAPYRPAVTVRGGTCVNSAVSADPGALRCFSGGRAADPCWQSGNESRGVDVACLTSPWGTGVLLLVNPSITAMPGASVGAVPWAMVIAQPGRPGQLLQCARARGPARTMARARVNWDCFHPGQVNPRAPVGYALGFPKVATGKPWTVLYLPARGSRAVATTVILVWH